MCPWSGRWAGFLFAPSSPDAAESVASCAGPEPVELAPSFNSQETFAPGSCRVCGCVMLAQNEERRCFLFELSKRGLSSPGC